MKPEKTTKFYLSKRHLIFFLLLIGLIGGAILRSSLATRLDSFTLDEAWHIAAGVAYVRTGDFRLNPEHPPLVKLWTGAFVASQGFQLSPYRKLQDKNDERGFVQDDVYLNNDPDEIQSRSRTAMFALMACCCSCSRWRLGASLAMLLLSRRRLF